MKALTKEEHIDRVLALIKWMQDEEAEEIDPSQKAQWQKGIVKAQEIIEMIRKLN